MRNFQNIYGAEILAVIADVNPVFFVIDEKFGIIGQKIIQFLSKIFSGIELQHTAGFAHDPHCIQIIFERFDQPDVDTPVTISFVDFTNDVGININAFGTTEIHFKTDIKKMVGDG